MRVSRVLRVVAVLVTVVCVLVFAGSCTSARPSYASAIQEGQSAAREMLKEKKGTAIQVALVDREGLIWTESFGLADREAGTKPSDTTMFGIGSVSKMFAAVAAMQLVERGLLDLDTPIVNYLPNFTMASPDYDTITLRMLLDHTSGMPGSDYRNVMTTSYHPGYVDQALDTLAHGYLKAAPGYTFAYCNDGFTLIEALVKATTGLSYAEFLQSEVLDPLGMTNTRLPVEPLPAGSFATAYVDGVAQPQEVLSALATGGVYSTASDMGRLARMFLGGGSVDGVTILSEASVASMGEDQTRDTFRPVDSLMFRPGLGWDTIEQAGLKAVNVVGWCKGGDTGQYGAALIVAPEAGLAAVAIGVSGLGSSNATIIAERVLLRAMVENGRLASFPEPLDQKVPEKAVVPDGLLESMAGIYASGEAVLRLQAQSDGTLVVERRILDAWGPPSAPLSYRTDGSFAKDAEPLTGYRVVSADGGQFLAVRLPLGYGHYVDNVSVGQRVSGDGSLTTAWKDRLQKTWLVVNEDSDSLAWPALDPRLVVSSIEELPGLICVYPASQDGGSTILDPSGSDTLAKAMLPTMRDLNSLEVFTKDGREWLRYGSSVFRPLAGVEAVPAGAHSAVAIGPEGYAEWRTVPGGPASVRITVGAAQAWHLFAVDDGVPQTVGDGFGPGTATLPAGLEAGWLLVFGDPGQTIDVGVAVQ